MSTKMKGNLALLFTAIIWGTGFVAQKIGMSTLTPIAFNGIRQLIAGIVLIPFAILSAKRSHYFSRETNTLAQIAYKRKRLLIAGLVCGLFLCIGSDMQQAGLVSISAGKSGFITSMYIVLVPVLSVFFGEKLRGKTIMCCIIAVVGFAMLSLREGWSGISTGDLITLLSNFGFAFQIIFISRFINKDNSIMLSVLQLLFTGIVSLILGIIIEHPTMNDFMTCAPVYIYAALVPSAIGYTFQIIGQKYTDATTAAFLMSLESVFAAIFGVFFLGESMLAVEIVGCVLILMANILCQIDIADIRALRQRRRTQEQKNKDEQ